MTEKNLSAFELAKRLQLVRSRKISNFLHPQVSSKSSTSNEKNHVCSRFTFFIVIDFESTCWPDKRLKNPSPEVIEFPAVLYDAKSRTVPDDPLAVFHTYVMPTEEPILSKFCTELTGIDQEKVNEGCPLPTTIYLFKKWITDISLKFNLCLNELVPGKCSAAFVTWTDWDLKICLENECKRKNINKPRYLDAWIDLKWTYQKFYGRRPKGLNGALKETGLDFDGREHSGIADAKNTAKLLGKMLDDRCSLGITKTINDAKVDPKLKFDESSLSMTSIKAFFSKQVGQTSSTENQGSAAKAKLGLRDVTNLDRTKAEPPKRTPFTGIRKTPPLCSCGRRSKRLIVSKPGPNQGRSFFACSARKSEASGKISGCSFFKWEDSDVSRSPNFSSKTFVTKTAKENVEQKHISKSFSTYLTKSKQDAPEQKCRPRLPVSATVLSIISTKNIESERTIFATSTISDKNTLHNEKVDEQGNSAASVYQKALKSNTSNVSAVPSGQKKDHYASESSRPTLGPARRSLPEPLPSVLPDGDAKTPEIKRARLNFHPPKFKNGKQQYVGPRVAQQYFGNVPLHFS